MLNLGIALLSTEFKAVVPITFSLSRHAMWIELFSPVKLLYTYVHPLISFDISIRCYHLIIPFRHDMQNNEFEWEGF